MYNELKMLLTKTTNIYDNNNYIKLVLTSKALNDPLLLAERAAVVLLDPQLHTAVVE